jgi:hypothetical protein
VLAIGGGGAARAATPSAQRWTLSWVGDIAFNTSSGLPSGGPRRVFAGLHPALASDLTMGNLEGTLGSGGTTKCAAFNCFAFQAPARYAFGLRQAGFDLMNQANNHAFDAGPSGQAQTLAALRRAHLLAAGVGTQITRTTVKGVRVAVVGFAPYRWAASLLDIPAAERLVRGARRGADVVIVIVHAGAEGADKTHVGYHNEFAFGENRGNVRKFAHAVVRAGADLVLGSGPHVVRGIQRYRGRLIAYSLGNFAGYRTLGVGSTTALSGVLRLTLDERGRVHAGRWVSVRLRAPGLPLIDRSNAAAHLVAHVSRQDFGASRWPMTRGGQLIAGSPIGRLLP